MSDQEKIASLIHRFQVLSVRPDVIFMRIMKRLDINYRQYSKALGKYPEYLNNRINKQGSKPLGIQDLFLLKEVVDYLMPNLKFSDVLEEALYGIRTNQLTGIALHKYYEDKIKELEKKLKKYE